MNTRTRILLPTLIAAIAVALAGCASSGSAGTTADSLPSATATLTPAPHWSYGGEEGPSEWGHLGADYAGCDTGTAQSPIDLPASIPSASGQLTVTTERTEGEVVDTGHTIQLTDADDASTVTFEGDDYELAQMHFHTPSEHTVAGQPAAVEFHFVHSNDDGELLVVGVLGTEGEESATWAPFVDALDDVPAAAEGEGVDDGETAAPELAVDIATLLPASLDHYAYEGSLTTPPCTEDVQWIVLSTSVQFSADQIAALAAAHEHNSRPVMPLGDREVTGGTGALQAE
ncbi:carbonic anhydrase [Herbiconiux sp. P15]|uniref:carbonic anhydrase n=1 Tax=Herbiconiux liukaitaii TaxID=3342799 RepID=UPI0035BAA60E